jgi:hypothetical protein
MNLAIWLSHCLLPAMASAFQPLVTDDTGTQGPAGNQIEFSYVQYVDKEAGAKSTTRLFPLVFTRGLTDTLDLYAGVSYVRFSAPADEPAGNGAGNPAVGLKWRFHENEADKWSLALKPEIRPAVSSGAENEGLGNGRANASGALIFSKETTFGAVHANLAVSTFRFALQDNRDIYRNALWRLSVAPVFDLTERWKAALDVGWVTNPQKAEKAGMGYVELGIIYSASKDLDFALGYIRDVRHEGHSVKSLTVGVTGGFGRFTRSLRLLTVLAPS